MSTTIPAAFFLAWGLLSAYPRLCCDSYTLVHHIRDSRDIRDIQDIHDDHFISDLGIHGLDHGCISLQSTPYTWTIFANDLPQITLCDSLTSVLTEHPMALFARLGGP